MWQESTRTEIISGYIGWRQLVKRPEERQKVSWDAGATGKNWLLSFVSKALTNKKATWDPVGTGCSLSRSSSLPGPLFGWIA